MRFVAERETGRFSATHETDGNAAGARALMPRCRIANFRLKFNPYIFSIVFKGLKKGKVVFVWLL